MRYFPRDTKRKLLQTHISQEAYGHLQELSREHDECPGMVLTRLVLRCRPPKEEVRKSDKTTVSQSRKIVNGKLR